ncbi:protein yellow-like [Venturia canescens]|uniref:protein yellow-like n=1 Tax=Venturia canescens TaxID=32260 RepID=UPI001C9BED74|nr:protein yellow-like [Venturia canescens]
MLGVNMKSIVVFRLKCFSLTLAIICGVAAVSSNFDERKPASQYGRAPLLERFAWKDLDWAYPDEGSRQAAIENNDFIPESALPIGIEVWRNKLFIGVPRWTDGIPATLNYISLDRNGRGSPKLNPYPSWSKNVAGACNTGFTNVYRMHADKCNRLWVLDTGTLGLGPATVQVCPYTLNIIDLTTDKVLRQYQLRAEDLKPSTLISYIAVDIGNGGCNDSFAYLPDQLGYGLIVYDWKANKSWRVSHDFFFPDPLAGDYNIAGVNFQWGPEGIFGMALSPIAKDGFRTLYFHPLNSNREFAVSTRVLRDEDLSANSYHEFQALPERYMGHSTAEAMDDNGVMVFNLIDQNAVGCWNSLLPYGPQNHGIIARHDQALIFPVDIKIVHGVVWMMSNRLSIWGFSEMDYNDVNFRIMTVPLQDAIAGTICQNTQWQYGTMNNMVIWNQ